MLILAGTALSLVFPAVIARVLDAATGELKDGRLTIYAIVLLTVFLVRVVIGHTGSYRLDVVGERVIQHVRKRLFAHLHTLDLAFFKRQRVGDLSSRLLSDIGLIREALTDTLVNLANQILMLLGSLLAMAFMSWKLTLAILVIAPVTTLLSKHYGKALGSLSARVQQSVARASAVAHESIVGVALIKQFARESHEEYRYGAQIDDAQRVAVELAWQRTLYRGLVMAMVSLSTVCIFWFGGSQVASGKMTAGELVAFLFYSENITRSLTIFTQLYGKYREADGASSRIFELFALRSSLSSPVNEVPMPSRLDVIEFANVDFRYDEGQPVLQGLDFTIRQGDVVALVGASGAGKSTVAQLLLRLYDVTSGSILLDGIDIREVSTAWLRRHVSMVHQDVFLFAASVRENIRYGRLEASNEDIADAAKAAAAHDFITSLPDGYDTMLGERGVNLSGGQRQRLALARSLLAAPDVLVLDEATSAVDDATERAIRDATLARSRRDGITLIIIAHRIETMRMADRMLVLENGRITMQGDTETILAEGAAVLARIIQDEVPLSETVVVSAEQCFTGGNDDSESSQSRPMGRGYGSL